MTLIRRLTVRSSLRAEVQELRARLVQLEDRQGPHPSEPEPVGAFRDATVSRRRFFSNAGALAAGGVAGAVLGGGSASASTGNMEFGVSNDSGLDNTELTSISSPYTLLVENTVGADALRGQATASGAFGVRGINLSTAGTGVQGQNDSSTGATTGVRGVVASTSENATGVQGDANGTVGTTFGVRGTNDSTTANAVGVRGDANGTSGATFGVRGVNISTTTNASGVLGEATGTSGVTYGVRGTNDSTSASAAGVRGDAEGASGATFGVRATNASTTADAAAMRAEALGATGATFGVRASNVSTTASAAAVRGEATGATGATFGVHGSTTSSDAGAAGVRGTTASTTANAAAVRGEATAASGATFGVHGTTASITADAVAVRGDATGTGGAVFGVRGTTASNETETAGVLGESTRTTGITRGVKGTCASSLGVGVLGRATSATGITYGVMGVTDSTSALSAGTRGDAVANAIGVFGNSAAGLGVRAQGGSAPLLLVPAGAAGAPSSGAHQQGELYVDNGGNLFLCTAAGAPGTWTQLNSQFGGSGSGFTLLPTPARVYDSRVGQPNQAPNVQGPMSFTAAPPSANNRVIRCSKDASTGAAVVPPGATALLTNLAAISIAGVGALSVYGDGGTQPQTSNLNWTAGNQIVANSATTACDADRDIRVAIPASSGASCNFVVDVFGYFTA